MPRVRIAADADRATGTESALSSPSRGVMVEEATDVHRKVAVIVIGPKTEMRVWLTAVGVEA